MKINFQNQTGDLKKSWESISSIPEDLTSWGFAGLTKTSIADSIGTLDKLAAQSDKLDENDPSDLSNYMILQNVTALRTYINSHIPGNPAPHISEFLNIIHRITAALLVRLADKEKGKPSIQNLTRTLAAAASNMSDASELYDLLKANSAEVAKAANYAEVQSSAIKTHREILETDFKAVAETKQKSKTITLRRNWRRSKLRLSPKI